MVALGIWWRSILVRRERASVGSGLLLIGHMDTVFEPTSSFQKYSIVEGTDGKVATGPGVCDMKGGLVVMLTALKAMKAAGVLDQAEIRIVLSGDEERHGNPVSVSRADMIEAAKLSDVALEFENASRVDGKDMIRTARRSANTWRLETTGKSGHSSQVFGESLGYGAIYEMARIVDEFRRELPEKGLTFNVGMVMGGATAAYTQDGTGGTVTGKSNVIPPVALATGDLRTLSNEQTERVEQKMRDILKQHLPKTGATISFDGGVSGDGGDGGEPGVGGGAEQGEQGSWAAGDEGDGSDAGWGGRYCFCCSLCSRVGGDGGDGRGGSCGGRDGFSGFDSGSGEEDGGVDVSAGAVTGLVGAPAK